MNQSKKSTAGIATDQVQITHHPEITPDCYFVEYPGGNRIVLLRHGWCSCPLRTVCDHRRRVAHKITVGELTSPQDVMRRVSADIGPQSLGLKGEM